MGCFLDFPELLSDEFAEEAIQQLEGDVALAVAALSSTATGIRGARAAPKELAENMIEIAAAKAVGSSQEAGQEIALDGLEILAHVPGSIHTFAAQRLASPVHEHLEDAKVELATILRQIEARLPASVLFTVGGAARLPIPEKADIAADDNS